MLAILVQRLIERFVPNPCAQDLKEAAYKRLVHPVLLYRDSVWHPQGVILREKLENARKRYRICNRELQL